jgi:L-galactose dehydrogenase/L-glyceraldehyde 3-phosphate reductase
MPGGIAARDAVAEVAPALEALRREGKLGFAGFTANGEADALREVVGSGAYRAAQVFYNLLNPSAGMPVPAGFPAQDFRGLLGPMGERGMGAVVVRVLAAGALSGTAERHPAAAPSVDPIASGPDYAGDARRAQAFVALVREGHAGSLVEASLRFPLAHPAVSTVLLGYSSLDQLELAAAAVARGPLSGEAMARLPDLWQSLARAGEA